MVPIQITLTDEQMEVATIASLQESLRNVDIIGRFEQSDEEKELIAALKLVLEFYGVKSDG